MGVSLGWPQSLYAPLSAGSCLSELGGGQSEALDQGVLALRQGLFVFSPLGGGGKGSGRVMEEEEPSNKPLGSAGGLGSLLQDVAPARNPAASSIREISRNSSKFQT